MAQKAKINYILLIYILSSSYMFSGQYCQNLGFELGNYTNWRAFTWEDHQNGLLTAKTEGVVSGKFTINKANGYDPLIVGNLLKLIPDGYNTSVKLGSTYLGNGGLRQSLTYTLDVTSENAFVIYHFAVVLQDPNNNTHEKIDEPRFKVSILNELGVEIGDCANYDVYGSDARIAGWQQSTYNNRPLYWRDWTAVGIDLTKYIGQQITLEFLSANCRRSGHFGYAYFVAECQPMDILVQYCSGDIYATLTAPDGFMSYVWKNDSNLEVGYDRTFKITDPVEGANYTCQMESETGCSVTLTSTVIRYEPNADFSYDLINCDTITSTKRFYNTFPPSNGRLEYEWDFGDGRKSTESSPIHTFTSSGIQQVSLLVTNPPSTCTDFVTKAVEIFYSPYIGIIGSHTYCPGYTTILKGYGADHYLWSNGSTNDSIEVGKDENVWLIGYSSDGCSTEKKYFQVSQEPDWEFSAISPRYLCKGDSLELKANGNVVSQLWNTGAIVESILVKTPGTFTVKGTNQRGCEKTASINVVEIELPQSEFKLSKNEIDRKNNSITVTAPQETGISYTWDFGDNTPVESGSNVSHTFADLPQTGLLTISLTAVNDLYGCTNHSSQPLIVEPFFPNVFTPPTSGKFIDGINDLFMPGLNIQITDRYGKILYKGDNGWDGTYQGTEMMQDTYFYFATYSDYKDEMQSHKGTVTLIR